MKKRIIRIGVWGGIGDALLLTPAVKALKQADPNNRVLVYYQKEVHRDVFLHNPYVDSLRATTLFKNPIDVLLFNFMDLGFIHTGYGKYKPSLTLDKPAVEILAEMLDVELREHRLLFFPSREEEQRAEQLMSQHKNPVVLHITSGTSKNQNWPLESWRRLVEAMPDITFVQIGLKDEARVPGAIDLCGALPLRDSLTLVKYAKSFVGVDSAPAHVTSAFQIPGVVLFGPSSPSVWGNANNINLYQAKRCAPCIDLLFNSKCPYGRTCMTEIGVERVRSALLRQLESSARGGRTPASVLEETSPA